MRFISWKGLAERRTTSVSTEKRRVKDDPRHPRPIPISPGRVAFVEAEIEVYDTEILIAEARRSTAGHRPAEQDAVAAIA